MTMDRLPKHPTDEYAAFRFHMMWGVMIGLLHVLGGAAMFAAFSWFDRTMVGLGAPLGFWIMAVVWWMATAAAHVFGGLAMMWWHGTGALRHLREWRAGRRQL